MAIAHKGYAAFEITTRGRAAHGSRPDLGEDAILAMGSILVALADLYQRLQSATPHPLLSAPSLHTSLIEGGQEGSSYPVRCLVSGEWRTIPGDDPRATLQGLVDCVSRAELRIRYPTTAVNRSG